MLKAHLDDKHLKNEFQVLLESHHPNVVRMFDIFQDGKNFYVVQEIMEGGDLYQLASQSNMVFLEKEVIEILEQVMQALNFLH